MMDGPATRLATTAVPVCGCALFAALRAQAKQKAVLSTVDYSAEGGLALRFQNGDRQVVPLTAEVLHPEVGGCAPPRAPPLAPWDLDLPARQAGSWAGLPRPLAYRVHT